MIKRERLFFCNREFAIYTLYSMPELRKWQKNNNGLHCQISHSRVILNGLHVAVAYNL